MIPVVLPNVQLLGRSVLLTETPRKTEDYLNVMSIFSGLGKPPAELLIYIFFTPL